MADTGKNQDAPSDHSGPREPASPDEARLRTRKLFKKYWKAVVAFFQRGHFGSEEAKDLAQDTFLRVHSGSGTYRHESEWNYLLKIANNVRLNAIRAKQAGKRKGRNTPLQDEVAVLSAASPEPTPEEETLQNERVLALREAIELLPPPMRNCLKMRLYEDLKYREVALAMGLSMDEVKKLLHEARRRLKSTVEEWTDGQFDVRTEVSHEITKKD